MYEIRTFGPFKHFCSYLKSMFSSKCLIYLWLDLNIALIALVADVGFKETDPAVTHWYRAIMHSIIWDDYNRLRYYHGLHSNFQRFFRKFNQHMLEIAMEFVNESNRMHNAKQQFHCLKFLRMNTQHLDTCIFS